ncbi:outer membrane beta-barrel protein [Burkholderiaceae bacterium DAT-1]|nr:outer membrane beta-barrel protein [Burkholderiaceae bacterium DAT-1]
MKAKFLASLIATVAMSAAMADAGDLLVRGRVVNVGPSVSTSDTLSTLNVDVKKDTIPELDFTYMVTENIGAELILGTSRHEVTAGGASLGKVSVLPPTVTAQYHFSPKADFRPYVGVGVNYTRFYSNDLKAGSTPLDIDKNSFGGALQAGFDVAINKDWFVNFDVKKVWLKTDVKAAGANLGTLTINPTLIGVGIGTKF